MTKNIIECSHCILGNGYAAIIASHLLKERGIDSVCVSLVSQRPSFALQLAGELISSVPIFPDKNSSLYRTLNLNSLCPTSIVDVEYSALENFHIDNYKFTAESLAHFVYENRTPQIFGLSIKQWGLSMLREPYREVQRKIRKNYIAGNNVKVGFYNGLSLYYHFMKSQDPNIHLCLSIDRVDYKKRIVFMNEAEIHYQKLISTIPIDYLFSICKIENTLSLKFSGSYFLYFTHSADIRENKVVYDCDLTSCIIRVFTATARSIIVQCSAYQKENINVHEVSKRICRLLPGVTGVKYEKNLFLSMSHPLEGISGNTNLESIKMLKENSVLPFGRLGNWEYFDLHELDWESII